MKKKKSYTVIDGFRQVNFGTEKEAMKYCLGKSLSVTNIFVDER